MRCANVGRPETNIASGDSAEHWTTSHDACAPSNTCSPVKGRPSIYKCIVDLVGAGHMGSDGALLGMQARRLHACAGQAAALSTFFSVPMPLTSISITSPAFMNTGGLRPTPTPAGVPVSRMSPGWKVYHFEK